MMMAGLRPIDTSDRVYSITPSSMSEGSVTSIAGFTLGADGVSVMTPSGSPYGSSAKVFGRTGFYVYAGAAHTEALFETKARGRDVVVTTWSRTGAIYLRCDRTTGRGIKIRWTGNVPEGQLFVSYATNVPAALSGFIPTTAVGTLELFSTYDLSSYVTGWNTSSTDGDEFEFSLIGSTLTIKWNSQTIYTTDTIFFHMAPGTVLYATDGTDGAVRDTEITFKASTATYTDYDNRVLDFRDWGWKQLSTTGSMSAGSTALTVASASGFAIGDRVLVATGGETGAGARGTVGVGGTWPRDRYANVAALPNATTYRAANGAVDCYVWVEDVTSVYINYLNAGVPAWGEWTDFVLADPLQARAYWHTTDLTPLALEATITNISGNTITLDTASDAATTNAEVWYQNNWIISEQVLPTSRFDYAASNAISGDGWEVRFPSGTFCCSGRIEFPWTTNWTYRGTSSTGTVIYGPKGAETPSLKFNGDDMHVHNMKAKGWAGTAYFGMQRGPNFPDLTFRSAFITGGTFRPGGLFENLEIENTWNGVVLQGRFGATARNITGLQTNGNLQQYCGWFFQTAYCGENTWMEDITYTATEVGAAFEIFQADGGGFRRCTSTQGYVASNSSGGGFLIEDMVIDIDWNYRTTALDWSPAYLPAININTNIGSGAQSPEIIAEGGTIRNPTITIVKDSTGQISSGAININGDAINITVEGTHPIKPGAEGVITMSDYVSGDAGRGAIGITVGTAGCVVRGMRVVGDAIPTALNFSNIASYQSDTVIENNVADQVSRWDGSAHTSILSTAGNITNAEYEALP